MQDDDLMRRRGGRVEVLEANRIGQHRVSCEMVLRADARRTNDVVGVQRSCLGRGRAAASGKADGGKLASCLSVGRAAFPLADNSPQPIKGVLIAARCSAAHRSR